MIMKKDERRKKLMNKRNKSYRNDDVELRNQDIVYDDNDERTFNIP